MPETVIKVEHLTKIYKLYDDPMDRLKETFHPLKRKYHRDFYALNDVSFEVKRGETVGIIGQNGSGKSSLLKIITGVLTPTSGNVYVNGMVSALLELGSGFNPELSGLENVFFNGSILGFSKAQMEGKLDDILGFADIGDFIKQPVKTYSSGMMVRLAFAVAINVKPDILIVDEALAVGDFSFQQKCFKRIEELQSIGCSILLVTHDLSSVMQFCSKSVLMIKGEKIAEGTPKSIVNLYKKSINHDIVASPVPVDEAGEISSKDSFINFELMKDSFIRNLHCNDYGELSVEIIDWGVLDHNGRPITTIECGSEIDIVLVIKFNREDVEPIIGYIINDIKGREIVGTNTQYERVGVGRKSKGSIIKADFRIKLSLAAGTYSLSLGCSEYRGDQLIALHRLYDLTNFNVYTNKAFLGFCMLNTEISIVDLRGN